MYLDQALTLKSQEIDTVQYSILEAAIKLGIGVFASVPLMQARLLAPNVLPEFAGVSKLSHRASYPVCKIHTWNNCSSGRTKISGARTRKSRNFI